MSPSRPFILRPVATSLLMVAISFYPLLYAVYLAMTDASMLRLARAQFIGMANFIRLADDPIFWAGLWRTLRWDVAVVSLELAIALPIALFLNLKFKGRGFVREGYRRRHYRRDGEYVDAVLMAFDTRGESR